MSEFFHMGGFGAFIWSAMAIAFVLMVLEPLVLVFQRKSILQTIKQKKRFDEKRKRENH